MEKKRFEQYPFIAKCGRGAAANTAAFVSVAATKAITKGGIDMIESEATAKGRRDFLKSVALGSAALD